MKQQTKTKQTITVEIGNDGDEKSYLNLRDHPSNSDFIELSNEGDNETVVFHKDAINSVIRALAKFVR
jgi:hypothetical protein